jgi:glyoxylase-like metal-dependent hydrolase (beta-lactamase superfamily II)
MHRFQPEEFIMTPIKTTLSTLFLSATTLLAAPLWLSTAHAAAPQVRTQAPGFYRVLLGDVEITALSDGTVTIPLDKLLTNTSAAHVDEVLAGHHLGPQVETSINAFLVNTGKRLVLIDTGAGSSFGTHGGWLADNIRASGYRPEDIDTVLLTHIHGDHSNGLTIDGKAVFPNAEVVVARGEADAWLDRANRTKVRQESVHVIDEALAAFAPYRKANRVRIFDGAGDVVPGIRAVPAPGHTPGHTAYEMTAGGQTIRFVGDLLHAKDVQMAEPQVTIRFDEDPAAARRQREAMFADAATRGYIVAAAHTPFPGLGHVERSGRAYAWTPLNYSSLR